MRPSAKNNSLFLLLAVSTPNDNSLGVVWTHLKLTHHGAQSTSSEEAWSSVLWSSGACEDQCQDHQRSQAEPGGTFPTPHSEHTEAGHTTGFPAEIIWWNFSSWPQHKASKCI